MTGRRRIHIDALPRLTALFSLVLIAWPLAPGALQASEGAGGRAGAVPIWHHYSILRDGGPLSAVVLGDLDPSTPGNESAAGGATGELWLLRWEGYEPHSSSPWSAEGEITALAYADIDPAAAGEEVVAGTITPGGRGEVHLLSRFGEAASLIHTGESGVVAVASGDLLPSKEGLEIAAGHEDGSVELISLSGGTSTSRRVPGLPGLSCMIAADALPSSGGEELLLGSSGGDVVLLFSDGDEWRRETIWLSSSGARWLAWGDADPLYTGPELWMGCDGGELVLLERVGDVWEGRVVWRSEGALRSVCVGDARPGSPGTEVLVGGEGAVMVVTWTGASWEAETVWSRSDPCTCVVTGEFDALHAGPEALVAGAGGDLSELGLFLPDIALSAASATARVANSDAAVYELELRSIDRLEGNVALNTSGLPEGVTVRGGGGTISLKPPGVPLRVELSVPASVPNGNYSFIATAFHQAGMYSSIRLNLSVERFLNFSVELSTDRPSPEAGRAATWIATVRNTGSTSGSFMVRARTDGGWRIGYPEGNLTGFLAPGESSSLPIRVSVPEGAAGKSERLTVEAYPVSNPGMVKAASMRVTVREREACASSIALTLGLAAPLAAALERRMLAGFPALNKGEKEK
ncbi:MAG: COG1470 family protein [Thermoplasmatota archaeon]